MWGPSELKIGIVIPARLESERLPNKVLLNFLDKPMIEHVWRRSQMIKNKVDTVIATDSNEIARLCESFKARTLMTSSKHINGLSRVGEVAKRLNWDFYLILQADEILIEPESLDQLIKSIKMKPQINFFNLVTNLSNFSELMDPNIVKCLIREDRSIMHIFRISGMVSPPEIQMEYTQKICGVYAISKNALMKITNTPIQKIEKSESIEQMKIIELGLDIFGVQVDRNYPSVNTAADALQVLNILQNEAKQKEFLNFWNK